MRKFLLFSLLALLPGLLGAETMLVVNPVESWQKAYSFPLSNVRSLSFEGGNLSVELVASDATTIPLSEIAELKFDGRSGIQAIEKASDMRFVYDRLAQSLRVDGMGAPAPLAVYSMDGRVCLTLPEYDGEDVDVSALGRGVYVVVVDNHSFKFAK